MCRVLFGRPLLHSADFRRIAVKDGRGRSERLFRAAVSAYCSLTRPTRRDAAQLDDLVAPLYAEVSAEAKRFAAAVLSDAAIVPPGLVALLAEEAVEVATPLLLRSPVFSDVQLLALISRHGPGHARAIAARNGLHPTIAALTTMIAARLPGDASTDQGSPVAPDNDSQPQETLTMLPERRSFAKPRSEEEARRALRDMMRPAHMHDRSDEDRIYHRLRDTALTGMAALFHTVLADCFELDIRTAQAIASPSGYAPLMAALRALGLHAEQAFVIVSAVQPDAFPHPEAIRLFLERYRLLEMDEAIERIRALKADAIHDAVNRVEPGRNDNLASPPVPARILRAS